MIKLSHDFTASPAPQAGEGGPARAEVEVLSEVLLGRWMAVPALGLSVGLSGGWGVVWLQTNA